MFSMYELEQFILDVNSWFYLQCVKYKGVLFSFL